MTATGVARNSGAVYLYTFSDSVFSGGALAARIGEGYTGGKNINQSLHSGDQFGKAVSLDGNRLAVGAQYDDGNGGSGNSGGVYLYTFSDSVFSGGALAARIGEGYTGGKNINQSLDSSDRFGMAVSLDGNNLAVGAPYGDGSSNSRSNSGDVYLYTFTDSVFSGGESDAIIGYGYSGGKNINQSLGSSDAFGASVSLDNNRLAVGSGYGDGNGGSGNSGEVYLYSTSGGSDSISSAVFATNSSSNSTITPTTITTALSAGTNVILQANNDITVSNVITAANGSGDGGNLTLQAGRSILVNANITTDNGNLTLIANDLTANGVVDAQRDSGTAVITLASGITMNTGTGVFTSTIRAGTGKTNRTSGDITLSNITAGSLVATNSGPTSGSDILDNGVLTIAGTSSFTTSVSNAIITLDSANVFNGAVSLNTTGSSGHATVVDASGLNLAASTVGGNLVATATTGNISDSGNLTVAGTSMFLTGVSGSNIILDASGNAFSNAVTLQADDGSEAFGNITFVDSGAVKLHSSAGANGDLYINAATDAAVGGDLNVTATTGNITQGRVVAVGGTSSFTTSANNADIILNHANAFTNAVSLNTTGSSGNASINNGTTALDIAASSLGGFLSMRSGNASGITDSGTVTVGFYLTANTEANNGAINLDQLAVSNSIFLSVHGTGNATLVNASTVSMADMTVGGNLSVTATTGNIQSAYNNHTHTVAGTTTLTTSANNADITLNHTNQWGHSQNNAFTGAVTLNTTGSSGHASIDNGTTALNIAASSVGGNLTLTSGHASGITDSGTVTVGGNLAATTDANSGVINLGTLAVDGTVALTTNGSGSATVVNDAGLNFAESTVRGNLIATATTGNMEDSGVLTIAGTSSFTTSANNADITLNNTNGFTGAVALNTTGLTGHATVVDSSVLNLGASTVGGNLSATATTGNIWDSGNLAVTGTATFITGASGSSIYLDASGNAFSNAVTLQADDGSEAFGHIIFVDSGAVKLHSSAGANGDLYINAATDAAVGGSLNITATTGNITQGRVVAVGGTSSFTTSANNATITLNNANAFTGAVALNTTGSSAHATVVDASGLLLAASTVGGNLVATATTGDMEDSGVLTIAGTSSFTTSATDAGINLNNTNAFAGAVSLNTTGSSAHATVVDASGLLLAASTVGGNLIATATTGDILDSGNLTITGTSTFITGADGSNIILDSSGNAFSKVVHLKADTGGNETFGNITFVDSIKSRIRLHGPGCGSDICLAINAGTDGAVGGNLSITSTTGMIDQDYALTVGGTSSFTTLANNKFIHLQGYTMAGNNAFAGAVALNTNGSSAHATLVDTSGLLLAASTVGGNLSATATTGNMEDAGVLTIAGTSSFTTSATDAHINLNNANAFTGAVALNTTGSSGNATVVDASGLNLGASTVGGNLSATATTGNIWDSGNIAVTGTATFITGASGSSIYLDASGNAFSNAVTLQADDGSEAFGNITFVDSGAVKLHSSAGANGDLYINAATDAAVGGNLNVTATTGNITQGRAVTVGGTSSFTTSANNADITLNTTTNAFTGAITLSTTGSSAHANIDGGTTALNIGASSVAGNLYLRTGNNITDSGTVTVGYGLVATTDENNGAINLGTLAVGSTVDLTTHGSGNATVVNDAVLILAASEVGGNLGCDGNDG